MGCYHIKYTGGTNPFGSTENVYHCDLCGRSWDWNDPFVENFCKSGDKYRTCDIWKKYAP